MISKLDAHDKALKRPIISKKQVAQYLKDYPDGATAEDIDKALGTRRAYQTLQEMEEKDDVHIDVVIRQSDGKVRGLSNHVQSIWKLGPKPGPTENKHTDDYFAGLPPPKMDFATIVPYEHDSKEAESEDEDNEDIIEEDDEESIVRKEIATIYAKPPLEDEHDSDILNEDEEVNDQQVGSRERVYNATVLKFIKKYYKDSHNKGVTAKMVAAKFGITISCANMHLVALLGNRDITFEKQGKTRLYYPVFEVTQSSKTEQVSVSQPEQTLESDIEILQKSADLCSDRIAEGAISPCDVDKVIIFSETLIAITKLMKYCEKLSTDE
jgi:hypothetical protein